MWWIIGFSVSVIWLMSIVFGLRKAIALDYVDREDRLFALGVSTLLVFAPIVFAPLLCIWFHIEWITKTRTGNPSRVRLFFNPAEAHDLEVRRRCERLQDQRNELRYQIRQGDFNDDPAIESAMIELANSLKCDIESLERSAYRPGSIRR